MKTDNLATELLSELLKKGMNINSWLITVGLDRSMFYKYVKTQRVPGKYVNLKLAALIAVLRGENIEEKIIPLLWEDNDLVREYLTRKIK